MLPDGQLGGGHVRRGLELDGRGPLPGDLALGDAGLEDRLEVEADPLPALGDPLPVDDLPLADVRRVPPDEELALGVDELLVDAGHGRLLFLSP